MADDSTVQRIQNLLVDERGIMPTEVLRRSRAWGYTGSRSAMGPLVKRLPRLRSPSPLSASTASPARTRSSTSGEATITDVDGRRDKIIFFAGRLKYSRFMHVRIGDDQRAETVVRGVLHCLRAFGGSPKEWAFDNPKAIRISPIGAMSILLHRYLRNLVAELRVIPTFCAPRSGNQEGSVERLVGLVKNSFFFARRLADRADVEVQLTEWLREVNEVPSRTQHASPCRRYPR